MSNKAKDTRNPLKHLKKAHSIHHAKMLANKHASRLRKAREPKQCLGSILAGHPDETVSSVRFRDLESLVERTAMLPATVTLEELQQQATHFFKYDAKRVGEVELLFPNEGIKMFDSSDDSRATNLEAEADWDAAQKEWEAEAATRRDLSLVAATHAA